MGHAARRAQGARGYAPPTKMRRRFAIVLLSVLAGALLGGPADAATAEALRGMGGG